MERTGLTKEAIKYFSLVGLFILLLCGVMKLCEFGGIGGAIDKWYEKDRAKCVEKAPVYGFTGEYRPYWDEDEHECIMITPDSIYKRLDERSIRRRLKE